MRKEYLWEIYDRWDGRNLEPDDTVHFQTLEDALETIEGFAEGSWVWCPHNPGGDRNVSVFREW